jgi:hypothetical protein
METLTELNSETTTTNVARAEKKLVLTGAAAKYLRDREEVIEKRLRSFIEVGRALLEIHDYEGGVLYRATYDTFEEYCRVRWGIGRARGYELMSAVKTYQSVSAQADKENVKLRLPDTEKQLRHLKALPTPELQFKAWKIVVDRAKPGQLIRSETVAKAVRQLCVQQGLPLQPKVAKRTNGRNHTITLIARDKLPLEDLRGIQLDELLTPTGVVYFKIGNFSLEEGMQILDRWKFSLKQLIAVVALDTTSNLLNGPMTFEPVLVGISKSVADVIESTRDVVLAAEQIADWSERLPPQYAQYIGDHTRAPRITRSIEQLLAPKGEASPLKVR